MSRRVGEGEEGRTGNERKKERTGEGPRAAISSAAKKAETGGLFIIGSGHERRRVLKRLLNTKDVRRKMTPNNFKLGTNNNRKRQKNPESGNLKLER
mmetsp:Transcript_9715/g.21637  ORF Transcript_9715/g.21637 Transcript_9715/m.21637 type:complete len:97 (+) Transcript_9715:1766-2056(+)